MQKFQVLFQDQNIAVINKSSGLLSVPYPGCRAKTAISLLEEYMRKRGSYSASHRPFAVHRLDKETSGVMMFALNERAQKVIMDSWQKMVTERLYRAVAENPRGAAQKLPDEGSID
ncbi:MAG: RluA family pseudouridine synthase, partial [Treponema sp.]|nr:RluA family pseudouridine synthase [Treponema sp.]